MHRDPVPPTNLYAPRATVNDDWPLVTISNLYPVTSRSDRFGRRNIGQSRSAPESSP